MNPIDGFTLTRDDFSFVGDALQRPECILAEPDGTLWCADARGGVVRITADGRQVIITQSHQTGLDGGDDASRFVDGRCPTDWPSPATGTS